MNFIKNVFRTSLLAFAALLIACNGNNPFKGGSNPVKNYPSANQGAPYVPGQQQAKETPPNNDQGVCVPKMHVSVSPDYGSLLLIFNEESQSTYTVTVTNKTDADFNIVSEGPNGSSFTQVSKDLNQAVYQFTWAPAKSKGSRIRNETLKIIYQSSSNLEQDLCGESSVAINLLVDKANSAPIVSFANLPETIDYSEQPVGFQIVVDDPASTQELGPDIKKIGFRNQASTGKNKILDASKAVECDELGQYVEGTKWVYNCRLSLNQIKKINTKSTTSATASFNVVAVSNRNVGKESLVTDFNLTINFPQAAPEQGAP